MHAFIGNTPVGEIFKMKNGYTFATNSGLRKLNARIQELDEAGQLDLLRERLRIGLHSDVQVTSCNWGKKQVRDSGQLVTQVFGSACAVAYSRNPVRLWAPFARLVLEASYEVSSFRFRRCCCSALRLLGSKLFSFCSN